MLKKVFIILSCIGLLFSSDLPAKTKTKISKKTHASAKNKLTKKALVKAVKKKAPPQEEESQENTTEQTETPQAGASLPSTENPIEGQITESKESKVVDQNGNTQKVTTIEYF